MTAEPFTARRIVSDVALILAALGIATLFLYPFRRRPDLSFRWAFAVFAGFLLAMAFSQIVRFSGPALSTAAALAAGSAGVLAMAYLLRLIPVVLSLLAERALAEMNERLQREVDERVQAEERLKQLNDELERRVQERW